MNDCSRRSMRKVWHLAKQMEGLCRSIQQLPTSCTKGLPWCMKAGGKAPKCAGLLPGILCWRMDGSCNYQSFFVSLHLRAPCFMVCFFSMSGLHDLWLTKPKRLFCYELWVIRCWTAALSEACCRNRKLAQKEWNVLSSLNALRLYSVWN